MVEKDRGVKFCVNVQLLSGQVFSHFGDLWLAGSHGGDITSGLGNRDWHSELRAARRIPARFGGDSELGTVAWWAFGIGCSGIA